MRLTHIGFTLIECLICIAIINILMLLAMPAYDNQVIKAQRANATNSLLILATKLEEYYFNHAAYTGATWEELNFSAETERHSYQFQMALGIQTYTVCAVPQGRQTKDTCGTLCYDEKGQKSAQGESGECW